jgi:hypothetical protein
MPTNALGSVSGLFAVSILSLMLSTFPVSRAADYPAPNPAGGITAWGKPVNGLQAGLRCPKGKQRIGPKQDDWVDLEIVIRNVSEDPIRFRYLPGVQHIGNNTHGTVEVNAMYSGNGRFYTTNIQPGDEMLLGMVCIRYAPRPAASGGGTYLRPGKYQVGADDVTMDRDAKTRKLGTGYLDIELRKQKKAR